MASMPGYATCASVTVKVRWFVVHDVAYPQTFFGDEHYDAWEVAYAGYDGECA